MTYACRQFKKRSSSDDDCRCSQLAPWADDVEIRRSGNTDRLYRVTLDCFRTYGAACNAMKPIRVLPLPNVTTAGDREAAAPREVPMADMSGCSGRIGQTSGATWRRA